MGAEGSSPTRSCHGKVQSTLPEPRPLSLS